MNPSSRRRARECAVQALYAWQISKNNIVDIINYFILEQDIHNVDISYFREILSGISIYFGYLDTLMQPYLFRNIEDLGHIEKAILRIALFELKERLDVPYKVAINEGIELAKVFGSEDSHKFINGVLDKIALQIRPNRK
ncbi:transcription antitermination factor NusB [Candidatus Erwinia haradaeae]|uniref:Transcription antitermination protein NusB n=1 Tax=Candidatus Erwinia haradaeae TaxID=1922217 RepID=A0A451D3Q8_9GAMM|nr:transcription antitermination factor NusB [Candidatus Erwinia haradaeae]VFP80284.1 Transcription antitermination protein NusB [Candidatus Erwinia haradaeae]